MRRRGPFRFFLPLRGALLPKVLPVGEVVPESQSLAFVVESAVSIARIGDANKHYAPHRQHIWRRYKWK